MSDTTQSPETVEENMVLPQTEQDQQYGRMIKRILGTTIFIGAVIGGVTGWLDGIRQEKHTNDDNRAEAEGLRRCADYMISADLSKDSTIHVKSMPPKVRKDCGIDYLPTSTDESLRNEGLAIGLTPGFEEAKTDIILRYDDDALAVEIYRLERDANDVAQGYSVAEGIGGMVAGGMAGFCIGALLIISSEVMSYRRIS